MSNVLLVTLLTVLGLSASFAEAQNAADSQEPVRGFIPLPKAPAAAVPAPTQPATPASAQPVPVQIVSPVAPSKAVIPPEAVSRVVIKSYQNNVYDIEFKEGLSLSIICRRNVNYRFFDAATRKAGAGDTNTLLIDTLRLQFGPSSQTQPSIDKALLLRCTDHVLSTQSGRLIEVRWVNLK